MQRRLWKEIRELLDKGEAHGLVVTGVSTGLSALNPQPGVADVAVFDPKTLREAAGAQEGSNAIVLKCAIVGEASTPLEGGRWEVEIFPPQDYPFKPCMFHLTTPCFHADVPLPPEHAVLEATEVDALKARISAARDLLAGRGGCSARESSSDSAAAELAPPTMTLTFKRIGSAEAVDVLVAANDTAADLKLRYMLQGDLDVSPESICLFHNRQELKSDGDGSLLSSYGMQDKDTIHVVWRLFAAPCGPFAILEGRCETCRDRYSPHSPALTIMKTLLEMRHHLHDYRGLRAKMEADVGIDKFNMSWSPWVAIYEPLKVRNLRAGVLLAEGDVPGYERQVAAFTREFA